jgi:uncharacterized protein YifN (PemK superfamily)
MSWLGELPTRGRIVCVNFAMGGGLPWHAELCGAAQPCLVMRVDRQDSPALVTVIPLTSLRPGGADDVNHHLELKSFRNWPAPHLFGTLPRYARCAHIATISLDRCSDPSYLPTGGTRLTSTVQATPLDVAAVEMGVLRALGIAAPGKAKAPQG